MLIYARRPGKRNKWMTKMGTPCLKTIKNIFNALFYGP